MRGKFLAISSLLVVLTFAILTTTGHSLYTENLKCLDLDVVVSDIPVQVCMADNASFSGSLNYQNIPSARFTGISIKSPFKGRLRFYVIKNGIVPPQFEPEELASATTPEEILAGLKQQYSQMEIPNLGSPRITIHGEPRMGVTFQTFATSFQDRGSSALVSYWSVRVEDALMIIELEEPLPIDASADALIEKYEAIRISTGQVSQTYPTIFLPMIKGGGSFADGNSTPSTASLTGSEALNDLPFPPWWNGNCNLNNYRPVMEVDSKPLGSFRGVTACGPRPYFDPVGNRSVNFFPGAHTQLEWQCVELVMRYMYLAYGTHPYRGAGNEVYINYSPDKATGIKLRKISNGTVGEYPKAGDIISISSGGIGHAAIVIDSNVDGNGNGTFTTLNQNYSDAVYVRNVSNWDAKEAIGWLRLPATSTSSGYFGSRGTEVNDVTGDGRGDAIVINDDKITTRRSNGSKFLGNESWTQNPYYGSQGTEFADVTGDGRADAIVVNNDRITVRRSDGSKFLGNEYWTQNPFYGSHGTYFADVTGDGKADAIAVNGDRIAVRRSDGSKFLGNEYWTQKAYFGSRSTYFADVTGDGKADAIVVNNDKITVRRSDGSKFLGNESWTQNPYYGSRGTEFADVTGDGKADAIVVNNDKITVRRSDGSKFLGNESWTQNPFYGSVGTYLADVTGDGKADAIVVNDNGITVRRSDGSKFLANESWTG